MAPPGIPKPIRRGQGKGPNSVIIRNNVTGSSFDAARKDVNKFINVSKVLAESIEAHNTRHQGNIAMLYVEFPDDGLTHSDRNRQALRAIDDHLEEHLRYKSENNPGEKPVTKTYYGKRTMAQVPRDILRKALDSITADQEFAVYRQASNNWAIKELVSQKMNSKSRKYRSEKKKRLQNTGVVEGDPSNSDADQNGSNDAEAEVNDEISCEPVDASAGRRVDGNDAEVDKFGESENRIPTPVAERRARAAFARAEEEAGTYLEDNVYYDDHSATVRNLSGSALNATTELPDMPEGPNELQNGNKFSQLNITTARNTLSAPSERYEFQQRDNNFASDDDRIRAMEAELAALKRQRNAIESVDFSRPRGRSSRELNAVPTARTRIVNPHTASRTGNKRRIPTDTQKQTRNVRGRFGN